MTTALSFEEVERMRQIVQMHDAQRKPMQTIDLNNPPKEPYRFQKFSMIVYDLSQPSTLIVRSEELQAALADGWSQQGQISVSSGKNRFQLQSRYLARHIVGS